MVAQLANDACVLGVVTDHHTTVAETAEVFGREKGQTAHVPEGAGGVAVLLCADRLRGVFDHEQIVLASDSVDGAHVGHLSEEMHGCDRASLVGDHGFDLANIDVEGAGLDVDKHWRCAEAHDRAGGAEKRVRGGDDFVAFANAHRHHGDDQCVGARGDADGVLGMTVVGASCFELFNRRSEDEILGCNDVGHRSIDLGLEGEILWLEVKEWDCNWI